MEQHNKDDYSLYRYQHRQYCKFWGLIHLKNHVSTESSDTSSPKSSLPLPARPVQTPHLHAGLNFFLYQNQPPAHWPLCLMKTSILTLTGCKEAANQTSLLETEAGGNLGSLVLNKFWKGSLKFSFWQKDIERRTVFWTNVFGEQWKKKSFRPMSELGITWYNLRIP